MSYTKYRSRGIIVGGSNIGEASRSYNIFTRDFGLIKVKAQGIRELKSKLKFHLQNLSFIDLHLIKGKNGWRITEAYKIKSIPDVFKREKEKLQSSTRILLFLKRMLPEEDSDKKLFDIIMEGLNFMGLKDGSDPLTKEDILNLESLVVLRVLRNLGYIESQQEFEPLLSNNNYDGNILLYTNKTKNLIIKEINQSIQASEL